MVGNDADTNSSPSQNNNANSYAEYLNRALQACAAGDVVLGLHLYLAAYERSLQDAPTPDPAVIDGLRQAWNLACEHKERSLAEYIFEKLEPYLSSEEVAQYAGKLQRLALDKLEEFGLSREDLEDMTDMISQDFFGMDPSSLFMRIEQGPTSSSMFNAFQRGLIRDRASEKNEVAEAVENTLSEKKDQEVSAVGNITSADVVKDATEDASVKAAEEVVSTDAGSSVEARSENTSSSEPVLNNASTQKADSLAKNEKEAPEGNTLSSLLSLDGTNGLFSLPNLMPTGTSQESRITERMTYQDLVGYERTIEIMRSFGIGMENDPDFKELVSALNKQHGLTRVPVSDAFLFRSTVREDANQFMLATMGEIGLPTIRMRMEENLQGMPVLCVMASSDNHPRMNAAKNAIEGGGVLILEDIDLWGAPLSEVSNDEMGGFMHAQLSRGAREAMNLIRSAVDNPEVYVLVSSSKEMDIDNFFFEFLEPLTVVDIDSPNEGERADLWANIVKEHPSLNGIDRSSLVRYTSGMSRFDIYMAAREAVESAYKTSLNAKKFIPVSSESLFEKIAAYQPLESKEYQALENAIADTFRIELDQIDDLLKGTSD